MYQVLSVLNFRLLIVLLDISVVFIKLSILVLQ